MEVLEISNPLGKLEYAIPIKLDTKKKYFFFPSKNLFVKYGLQYNDWVVHLVINDVDAMDFQKRK